MSPPTPKQQAVLEKLDDYQTPELSPDEQIEFAIFLLETNSEHINGDHRQRIKDAIQ